MSITRAVGAIDRPRYRGIVVRLLLAAYLVVGAIAGWAGGGLGGWVARIAAVACALVLVLWAPAGELPWGARVGDGVRWATFAGIALSATVTTLAAPRATWVFICFAPAVIAGRNLPMGPALAAATLPALALGRATWVSTGSPLVGALMLVAVGGTVVVTRLRADTREASELAAAQREALAQERARSEAAAQREVMASQVHDVLAHTLSGLIVSLQTAGLQARREGVSEALSARLSDATALAREGLAGAASVVAMLSGQEPPARPIAELTDSFAQVSGAAAAVTGSLALLQEQRRAIASAVVGEALTNSLRYSRGCDVRIEIAPDSVVVQTIGQASEVPDHHGSGRGLAGLRARVRGTGGTLTAGPTDAGWRVALDWLGSPAGEDA